ncbi:Rieske (2Fe-2S) protein [Streptomyces sp. ISID311]|uniref:Rieske (2Fe-2S) protein n=1 Tax=Streptomyces sp. ISID311 TaxID=2601673 RepID=UPI0011BD332B|nr:Rieske (2Fe-2S) protein [Streptomyces sp. ISID311]TXC98603.1 Rieske (2Fe-2S) protein [Streptomyces sp. ISID311]
MTATEETGPSEDETYPAAERGAGRRAVVAAVGAAGLTAALAACGGSKMDAGSGDSKSAAGEQSSAGASGGESGSGGGSGSTLAKTSEIPKGGGKIFKAEKVVVTQPQDGEIKAFSAICTHAGCVVGEVSGGTINCMCHGSKFDINDGSVKKGPATKALAPAKVDVKGGSVTLG